jgi:hypothetical protein
MMSTPISSQSLYKGKFTNRSWTQLPSNLIHLIADYLLHDIRSTSPPPRIWQHQQAWAQRRMFLIFRDAPELTKMMNVHPTWGQVLEYHSFWEDARRIIDPHSVLHHLGTIKPPTFVNSSSAPPPFIILSPYRHFIKLSHTSCHVCRVNAPPVSLGLGAAKRQLYNSVIGNVFTCKEHRKGTFCGLCLQTCMSPAPEAELIVGVHENEDEETWPTVDSTCRLCREDGLMRRVWPDPELREAVGGRHLDPDDWETRYVVESFIDTADGTIEDVVKTALEKRWLRKFTRLQELLRVAILSTKYSYRPVQGRRLDQEEEEDPDLQDPELLSLTEEREGVRDLAMSDWARTRIMDGHWLNPADTWYKNTNGGRPTHVRAVHPCPWTDDDLLDHLDHHPQDSTVSSPVPPTFELCDHAYRAHAKQMRLILAPALANVVRKLIIECIADGIDPAVKAARMDMEDIIAELREEGVWYNGMDWLERRRNAREESSRHQRHKRRETEEEVDSDSASSKSDSTSPVLSITTVQTTPSPPPSSRGTKDSSDDEADVRQTSIPISPILNPPVLLQHIPFVPTTTAHLPHYSMECLKSLWREACQPLYHCRCSICDRAMKKTNATPTHTTVEGVPDDPAIIQQQQAQYYSIQQQVQLQEQQKNETIPVKPQVDSEPDVESEYYSDDELSQIHSSEDDDVVYTDEEVQQQQVLPAPLPIKQAPPSATISPVWAQRKRSSDELDRDDTVIQLKGASWPSHPPSTPLQPPEFQRTPPKRARLDPETPTAVKIAPMAAGQLSPSKQRKRNSEELEDAPGMNKRVSDLVAKKARIDTGLAALPDGGNASRIVGGEFKSDGLYTMDKDERSFTG